MKFRIVVSRKAISTQVFIVEADDQVLAERKAKEKARHPASLHLWNYRYTNYETEEVSLLEK